MMKVTIKSNYLVFPVGITSAQKELIFSNGNKVVYNVVVKLDNCAPDFYTYIDVARFKGQTLEISVQPEMEIKFRQSDTVDVENLYNEPYRPQIHFTPKNGWLNDPNGLIYVDGTYHMFFQYNPGDIHVRKSKHWGHAVSLDLIHWREEEIALYPDERGAMFSGSAITDERNLLGKNDGDNKAVVLFYTTTMPYAQNMSYSTDNFKTISHYEGNPIIPFVEDRNRDPKVVFCDELGCYIMILYIKEDLYYIYTSDNLVDWTLLQSINMEDEKECPDIFPINDADGNRRWVIMGAHDKYLVGSFENGKFTPEQDVMSLHYGVCAYAGQTFSNLPSGRVVRMVWNRWYIKPCSFNGQMGIPMELSLSKLDGVYYLEANPVKELEALYKDTKRFENIVAGPQNDFNIRLEDLPHIFRIKGDYTACGAMTLSIFGRIIEVDFSANEVRFGFCTSPVSITKNGFDITVIADRSGMEVFLDGGKAYMSCLVDFAAMDRNLPYFTVKSENGQSIKTIEITSLKSIWS